MDLLVNQDGSIDLYFWPDTLDGKEANWIPTVASKAWFLYFLVYSPKQVFWIRPGY